ncbi:MAG: HigA family addiction module antitoxin [Pseudomonadota bacterium]
MPKNRIPTHPGELLLEEFLKPMGLSQREFAKHINVSAVRLNELIRGKRGITPDTAWRLSQALGTTPEIWMSLQAAHDLAQNRPKQKIKALNQAA